MNKQWKQLMMLALALLVTVVGCGPRATPTPLPKPTVEPEVLATKNEDVVGVWLMISSPTDSMHPTKWLIEHTAGGARNYTIISGVATGGHGEGKFWFEGGLYKVQIPEGTEEANSTSIGTYQVYVTRQGGKPIQLRFVVVDDPFAGRRDRLTYKPLTPR